VTNTHMCMQGLELFEEQFGRKPDLVLVQSAFWELATLWKEDTQDGSRDPLVLSNRALPQPYLDQYMADTSGLISHLKVSILVRVIVQLPPMYHTIIGFLTYWQVVLRFTFIHISAGLADQFTDYSCVANYCLPSHAPHTGRVE